ncbi:PREDICTED: transcription factor bHLH148-like [Populus euphratica]|uniref:Transcription factor bHLH148-like n=1 Tax=Populus euphratica TaxID=75702 RepID=A0AAJ6TZD8_POPEU|nr:PREDICTED: transcription factor bHLH148-like [Populus euphratica]XP_011019711.1 PREDICTED: transcription factor bHLH148-like [Populus euphratica]
MMMTSSTTTTSVAAVNTNANINTDRTRRKKKKKSLLQQRQSKQNQNSQSHAKWKTEAQQQIYSSKLIQALSQVNLNPSSSSAPRQGRAVREVADRALAFAAKGKTRWSRAILTNRIKLKFRKQQHKRQRLASSSSSSSGSTVVTTARNIRSSRKHKVSVLRLKGKGLPAVQRKVRVLGRLVPGCRKQPLPIILEEATDYIAALEMQVKAMSAIAELLSRSSSGAGSSLEPMSS